MPPATSAEQCAAATAFSAQPLASVRRRPLHAQEKGAANKVYNTYQSMPGAANTRATSAPARPRLGMARTGQPTHNLFRAAHVRAAGRQARQALYQH